MNHTYSVYIYSNANKYDIKEVVKCKNADAAAVGALK